MCSFSDHSKGPTNHARYVYRMVYILLSPAFLLITGDAFEQQPSVSIMAIHEKVTEGAGLLFRQKIQTKIGQCYGENA